ncbi:MAG: outer membrane beta-barrel protein [Bacteroidales bacterium]|nr:outer membrane beta-barrel protein [Bacteroidales bacterium]
MKKNRFTKTIFLSIIISIISYGAQAQIVKAYGAFGTNLCQVDGDQAFGYRKFGVNVGVGSEVSLSDLLSISIEANFNQKGAYRKMLIDSIPAAGQDVISSGKYKLTLNYAEVPVIFHVTDRTKIFKVGVGFSVSRYVSSPKEIEERMNATNYIIYNNNTELVQNESTLKYLIVYPENGDYLISYADFEPEVESEKGFEYLDLVREWNAEHSKIRPFDYSIIGDLNVQIWRNLKFNFRFAYSLRSLRTVDYYRDGSVIDTDNGVKYFWDGEYLAFRRKEFNNSLTFRLIWAFNEEQTVQNKIRQKTRGGDIR